MPEVYVEDNTVKTEIDTDITVNWADGELRIMTASQSIFLSMEAAQNLLNYLEGKRPKVVWE